MARCNIFFRVIGVAAALLMARAAAQTPGSATTCRLEAAGTAKVASVRDGRSFTLDDGREVRLAGIEVPARGASDAPALAAKAALAALIADRTVTLKGRGQDRYGRLVAYAYLPDSETPVQTALLGAGHALVATNPGSGCAEPLLAAERKARAARLGLWADPNFAPLRADDYGRFRAERGRFVLVEGKVLSVRQSGATIYVNFGRRFTRDLSLTILRRLRGDFTAAGVEPSSLQGRRIRARGWLEYRRGPIVDVAAPEQIEIIE